MTQFMFLRHAETKKHHIDDFMLDEISSEGKAAILGTLEHLKKYDFCEIYSSEQVRSIQTAQEISKHTKLQIKEDSRLNEISRGVYNNMHINEFYKVWEKHNFSFDYVPPNGESVNMGRKRISKFIEEILITDKRDVLCVSHMGLIANLLMSLFDFSYQEGKPKHLDPVILSVEEEIVKLTYLHGCKTEVISKWKKP